MASRAGSGGAAAEDRRAIPFWRNVRTLSALAQVAFAVAVLAAVALLVRNVAVALQASNVPADFSFLDNRAGIPIAETPIPYSPDSPYWKALLIGVLNTLKVALLGVALASLLGVLVGVMRLSSNWLLTQIASGYVELIRNTPLAVQIIFWYTAALATLPPNITYPVSLPFGFYLSNRGVAVPFVYPGAAFNDWLPWVIAAVALFVILLLLGRRRLRRADRPGSAWPLALLGFLALAGVGYFVAERGAELPEGLATDFRADRGRGTVFIDEDGDARLDSDERVVAYAPAVVGIEEGVLTDTTQNLVEQRRVVPGTFRFPLLLPGEFETAEVRFAAPADEELYDIHFLREPSIGIVYRDLDDDGEYDPGEALDPETGEGYSGVELELHVTGFHRRVVADREGQLRIPRFEAAIAEADAEAEEDDRAGGAVARGPRSLFGAPVGGEAEEAAELQASFAFETAGPLVYSPPSIPVSNYEGGFRFTTSFLALLLALVLYTAAFISEIVRGGILAVPRGQTEAAKALGLSNSQTFRLIVFPQAVRIILPPMISQYLNLTKNSSLGPLAAYGELFAISTIVANQTGASVPVTVMIIAAYLLISFVFALVLNVVNARMAIVER